MAKGNKEFSDKQEKLIANYLNWSQVCGSGSRPNYPGDISSDEWLGECKTHTKPGCKLIFDFKVWDKICEEATSQFKQPILFTDDGSQKIGNTYCMIDISDQLEANNSSQMITSASISYSLDELSNHSIKIVERNNNVLMILPLVDFKEYIGVD